MASRANGGAETYSADMMESLHRAGVEQVAVIPRASIHHARLEAAGVRLGSDVLDARLGLAAAAPARGPDRGGQARPRALLDAARGEPDAAPRRAGHRLVRRLLRSGQVPALLALRRRHARHRRAHGASAACRASRRTTCRRSPPSRTARRSIAPRSATPAGATVLLALSRLHEKKGLDVLLRALAELPGCVAWIAGDGPLEADLKALAAKLGVADRARFLGWRSDRGALLRAADICVLPSRWEPFGTVMLEAWAAGMPLVAAASQGPKRPDRRRRQRPAGAGRRCACARRGDPAPAGRCRRSGPT